jgi:hypothetical protein
VLFTFPSRYWFTIGLSGVFSLTGWSRLIHAEFLVLRATQDTATVHFASCTGLSPSMDVLSRTFHSQNFVRYRSPTTPLSPKQQRFGLFRFRSPLLAESFVYFLLLRVLRCFSSPRSLSGIPECHGFTMTGCPIRISLDQWSFAPPQSFSQLITSFFASESLGIRRPPLSSSLLSLDD